eukprot:UN3083
MVLALNVSVYFCKLLPLHMNGNLPVGIGMHVFAMICDLIWRRSTERGVLGHFCGWVAAGAHLPQTFCTSRICCRAGHAH